MRCLLALICLMLLLEVGFGRPKKSSKIEKAKEKNKHKSGDKKSAAPEPEKTQKGTKKQMLGGLGGGEEQQIEGLPGAQYGGGGMGGEIEGMPTGMGAGAEPLGFGPMGASPMGQLGAAIPGIANPQAEDSRMEDGPRGTPIGLLGMAAAGPPNGEEQLEGGPDQAPIAPLVGGGLPSGPEGPVEGALEQSPFAPGIGGGGGGGNEYSPEDNSALNSLPSGNMISPVINGGVEDGIAGQQGLTGMANSDIQDNQLVGGMEQQEGGPQDLGQEAASIAKMSDNADVGAAMKEIEKVPEGKDVMHQEMEGRPMQMENPNAIQTITSAESAEMRQTAKTAPSFRKSASSSLYQTSQRKLYPSTSNYKTTSKDSSPANIKDVEATSMTGGQVMMGVQGGMKRHNLKKTKPSKKSSKVGKKKSI